MSEDAHARPTRDAPESLYDAHTLTPTHAERARTLVAQISTGTRWSPALEPEGYPYGSFVTVAFDDGNPIFLISELAEHTKNLERDPPRVAAGGGGRLGRFARQRPRHHPRTVHTRAQGDCGSARAAFFAAHPNSTYYADFRDFGFWKLNVDYVRYIGGYGRMSRISKAEWRAAEPGSLSVRRPPT